MRGFARASLTWLATLAFSTAGAQQLTANFDDITTLAGAGWVFTNNSAPAGVTGWFQGNTAVFPSQAGAADSYLATNFNAAAFGGDISLWAVTPTLSNLQNGEVLTFYTRTEPGASAADRLEVRVSTNGSSTNVGATTTSLGDFTTLLATVNPTFPTVAYPSAWTQFTVTLAGLPAGVSTGRIGFRYFVTDTSANGDYIGIDTVNLTNPAADLSITKTHSGNFTQGQTGATYTIALANTGPGSTSGTVTVSDSLPVGLLPTGAVGSGWACSIVAQVMTCSRSDVLAASASYPAITLTVNVAGNAPASVTNTATVASAGDPNGGNDSSDNPTTINPALPDLTLTKSHAGSFLQGQSGATYSITATNAGNGPTTGTVTVSDIVPTGLTPIAASGAGWTCPIVAQVMTCTRSDVLAASASYPAITLTVNVSPSAPLLVTNTATVAGGGETNAGNNSASDPATVTQHVLDIDANGSYDALTDGLLIVRYLSGVTGTALSGGALGAGATRSSPAAITLYLDGIKAQLNVDGNAQSDALTDGLMLIRYLFGLRGPALIDGAVGTGATRLTAAVIETYIQSLMP